MRILERVMRRSNPFTLVCLGVFVFVTSVRTIKLPTCNVKTGNIKIPCFIFEQNQDCCSLDFILSNNDSILTHNITTKRSRQRRSEKVYMPRYITFPFSTHLNNEFVLMLHHEMPEAPPMCWNVQMMNATDEERYDDAEIKFILRSDFMTGWTAITYNSEECEFTFNETANAQSEKRWDKSIANKRKKHARNEIRTKRVKRSRLPNNCIGTSSCECERFRKSMTRFKATSSRKELEFDINWNHSTPIELLVNVLSADHNITCGSGVNSGYVTPPMEYRWNNISEPWRLNVSIGYHCLTISLQKDEDCIMYTDTTFIEDLRQEPPIVVFEQPTERTQLPSLVMVAVISSLCLAALIFAIYKHRGKFKFNRKFGSSSPAVKTPLLARKMQVLLIYSRDSEEFVKLVTAFRHLLELCYNNIEVFDPMDESQNDNIFSCNSEVWLTELLYSPNVKVIFISSEGAILRLGAQKNGNLLVAKEPHCLDVLFTSALNHLRNPQLCSDYKRIFLVRFDGLPSELPTGITPFRCYMLLNHFDHFLIDITGINSVSTIHTEDYDKQYFQGVEEFQAALEEVMRIRERNPNYQLQRWLVIKP